MKKAFLLSLIGGVIYLCIGFYSSVFAFEIESLPNVLVTKDFTLGPGKIEVFLNPGEEEIRNLQITNRLGKTMNFNVEIEDFEGSLTGETAVILLGGKRGPYSLRDYLHPEVLKFQLAHGERMNLPIKISIPKDMEPGGLYGSVLIVSSPLEPDLETEQGKTKGQVKLVARIGSLFFVRIKGDVQEQGELEKFDTLNSKRFYQKGPIDFSIFYRNQGNVHLNPYGTIEIKNILNKKIGEIITNPYFAMPKSLRYREVKWERGLALGRYTAVLSLNRGYQDIIDTAKVSFWIIPWKILLIVAVIFFLLILFIWWFVGHFEIKKKS